MIRIRTRNNRAAFVLAIVALLGVACTEGETESHKLYFLGGQSNMVGYGFDIDGRNIHLSQASADACDENLAHLVRETEKLLLTDT